MCMRVRAVVCVSGLCVLWDRRRSCTQSRPLPHILHPDRCLMHADDPSAAALFAATSGAAAVQADRDVPPHSLHSDRRRAAMPAYLCTAALFAPPSLAAVRADPLARILPAIVHVTPRRDVYSSVKTTLVSPNSSFMSHDSLIVISMPRG